MGREAKDAAQCLHAQGSPQQQSMAQPQMSIMLRLGNPVLNEQACGWSLLLKSASFYKGADGLWDGSLPSRPPQNAYPFPFCFSRSDFPPHAQHFFSLNNHHPQPLISTSVTTPGTKDALFTRGRWLSANYKAIRPKHECLCYLISVGGTLESSRFVPIHSFSLNDSPAWFSVLAGRNTISYSKPESFR